MINWRQWRSTRKAMHAHHGKRASVCRSRSYSCTTRYTNIILLVWSCSLAEYAHLHAHAVVGGGLTVRRKCIASLLCFFLLEVGCKTAQQYSIMIMKNDLLLKVDLCLSYLYGYICKYDYFGIQYDYNSIPMHRTELTLCQCFWGQSIFCVFSNHVKSFPSNNHNSGQSLHAST